MKRVVLSMLIFIAAFSSCKKDGNSTSTSTDQTIAVSSLPTTITDYVANNYPAETISSVLKVSNSTATYIVSLNTLEELAFTGTGNFLGDGTKFHHGGGCDSTGFIVGDSTWHPGEDSLGHHGHHGGHGGHNGHGEPGSGNIISLDSLPTALTDFLTANYAGYTAQHAEKDTVCQFGAVIELMLEKQGIEPLKLFFTTDGTFLMKAERSQYSSAPQVVVDYITANYAGYTVRTRMETFTMADNSLEYNIFMALGTVRKSITMTAAGTFVCER